MDEHFRVIPGYENLYAVSNLGNVKSIKKNTILKPGGKLYPLVGLSKNNKKVGYTIHQLVAMAFLDHSPNGYNSVIDHIDGNPMNNRLDNLQVVTQRENIRLGWSRLEKSNT